MRILILIIIVFSLLSCADNKSSVEPPIEYYFFLQHHGIDLTDPYSKMADTVQFEFDNLFEKKIKINNNWVSVKKYSSWKDEIQLFYADTLLIYGRSLHYPNRYRVLRSNNDSVNIYINQVLATLLGHPGYFEVSREK